jgi:hypothetical protein
MTELQVFNVIVEGDKTGFNSKNAVDKFKQAVKSSNNFDLVELTKKYVKSGFVLEQVEKTDTSYKFMLGKENTEVEKQEPQLNEKEQRRKMLKAKINLMRQDRTNSVYHKAKANDNVPPEILNEYMKLKQISKMPIPEPNEIFAHPEEYKPIVSMVLQNSMMKQLGSNHPYVRYFKLIADKLGVETPLPIPTQNFLSEDKIKEMKELVKNQEQVVEIKGNEMSKGDETDSEDEIEV